MGCADAITATRHAAIVKITFFIVSSLKIFGCNYYSVVEIKLKRLHKPKILLPAVCR
jgi:hypothetical protein